MKQSYISFQALLCSLILFCFSVSAQTTNRNSISVFGAPSYPLNIKTYQNKPGLKAGLEYEIKNNYTGRAFTIEMGYIQYHYKEFNALGNLILAKAGLKKYWTDNFYAEGNAGVTLLGNGILFVTGAKTGYNLKLSKQSSLNLLVHYDFILPFDGGEITHFISPGIGYKLSFRN